MADLWIEQAPGHGYQQLDGYLYLWDDDGDWHTLWIARFSLERCPGCGSTQTCEQHDDEPWVGSKSRYCGRCGLLLFQAENYGYYCPDPDCIDEEPDAEERAYLWRQFHEHEAHRARVTGSEL